MRYLRLVLIGFLLAAALTAAIVAVQQDSDRPARSCEDARARGLQPPIVRGERGYNSELDQDGDGVMCE